MRASIVILCVGFFAVFAVSLFVIDTFFVRALTFVLLPVVAFVGIYFSRSGAKHFRQARLLLFIGLFFLALFGVTNAPLKVAFALFEPKFDALADRIARDDNLNYPIHIGPFRIIDGGIRDGSDTPDLMTSGHSDEINAFVRDPEGRFFNLWSLTKLGDGWSYIEED